MGIEDPEIDLDRVTGHGKRGPLPTSGMGPVVPGRGAQDHRYPYSVMHRALSAVACHLADVFHLAIRITYVLSVMGRCSAVQKAIPSFNSAGRAISVRANLDRPNVRIAFLRKCPSVPPIGSWETPPPDNTGRSVTL